MGWESAQAPLLPSHPLSLKLSGPSSLGWACQDPATLGAQPAAQMRSPHGENPLPADGGAVPGQRSQLPAANSSAVMACSLSSYCPFPGLWPSLSRWGSVHFASEALGSTFLRPRSQMQFRDILFGQCRALTLNCECVSRPSKGSYCI